MSNSTTSRNRFMLPPKAPIIRALDFLNRPDVWLRVGLCVIATVTLWVMCAGWAPPFKYRVRQAPLRNLHARTVFQFADVEQTEEARRRARSKILCLYEHDRRPLEELRQALFDALFKLTQSPFDEAIETWPEFFDKTLPPDATIGPDQANFNKFNESLAADEKLEKLRVAVGKAFFEIDKTGLLESLGHELGEGSMTEIEVYSKGNLEDKQRVEVEKVRIIEVKDSLHASLIDAFNDESEVFKNTQFVADRIYDWLRPKLQPTLTWDEKNSRRVRKLAANEVEPVMREYQPGDALKKLNYSGVDESFITGGVPLDSADIVLLTAEHDSAVEAMTFGEKTIRTLFFFGQFVAIFALAGGYLYYRDRTLLTDIRHFSILLGLMVFAFGMAWLLALNVEWRSEIIPVVIFAMTIAIAYNIELAIVLSSIVSVAFVVSHGFGLGEFIILSSASSTSALLCRTIRSRTKLVYIGLIAASVSFPVVIGVNYLLGQPLGTALLIDAFWYAGGAGLAGLFMTALLPFLEQLFDIQTDISLLELSDANHPLLKELVQRAPGTYNHSINVASIAEAAADSINANGLLCRVAAYFHDVGKLRKPDYFIENQGGGANKHDDLLPTMSTIVIIAHVKDGAEIARNHRLPKRIIDMIEQHHGTTLVEYFYRRAEKQNEEANNGGQIDESEFRYPGPPPQTPEAAVMMLSDAVESASRALREPTPARIENLVREIAKKRLDDGQFDQCSITIEQLNTIQQSLIKSLNAMYHARVKYPDQQQTA